MAPGRRGAQRRDRRAGRRGVPGVALWLALTRYPADPVHQQRVIAGFLLGRASYAAPGGWRDQYQDSRALLQAINTVLAEHLAGAGPADLPPGRADRRAARKA
jgi:hypothetical protein